MTMRTTVYIETTVPSYYCDDRPALVDEIERTREWWDHERSAYECFISPTVVEELERGEYPGQARCLELVASLPVLRITDQIIDVAEAYRERRLMPRNPAADSIHLALASYYRMDYLLTWNCRHLANANKVRFLETINHSMGLHVPLLVTPLTLQPWEMEP